MIILRCKNFACWRDPSQASSSWHTRRYASIFPFSVCVWQAGTSSAVSELLNCRLNRDQGLELLRITGWGVPDSRHLIPWIIYWVKGCWEQWSVTMLNYVLQCLCHTQIVSCSQKGIVKFRGLHTHMCFQLFWFDLTEEVGGAMTKMTWCHQTPGVNISTANKMSKSDEYMCMFASHEVHHCWWKFLLRGRSHPEIFIMWLCPKHEMCAIQL